MTTDEEITETVFSKEKVNQITELLLVEFLKRGNNKSRLENLKNAAKDIYKIEKQKEIDDGEAAFKAVTTRSRVMHAVVIEGLNYFKNRDSDYYQKQKSGYDNNLQKELDHYKKIRDAELKKIEEKFDKLTEHIVKSFLETMNEVKIKPPA